MKCKNCRHFTDQEGEFGVCKKSEFHQGIKRRTASEISGLVRNLAWVDFHLDDAALISDYIRVKSTFGCIYHESNEGLNLGIIGTRTFSDYPKFCEEIEKVLPNLAFPITRIISGSKKSNPARPEKGADEMAERWAKEKGLPYVAHLPDWFNKGKAAGPIRNAKIVEDSDVIIAFWDGKSAGTQSAINIARNKGRHVTIISI